MENPVPEEPHKKETDPYEGTGVLGGVKVGDEITYEISYKNYKDRGGRHHHQGYAGSEREFVNADNDGTYETGIPYNWTLKDVPAGEGRHSHADREGAGRRAGQQEGAKARSSTAARPRR